MSVDFKIHHVHKSVIAFSIDFDFYFLRVNPVPQIFDINLTPHTIANIDSWFQAKTHQRYSYQGFLDMAGAFMDGLKHTYSGYDLEQVCERAATATKHFILTEKLSDYMKAYWIEAIDRVKLERIYVKIIRDKFEKLRIKLGDDELFNNLCRFYKNAYNNYPKLAPIFDKFIKRLNRSLQDPHYPETVDLDNSMHKFVYIMTLGHGSIPEYKNVSLEIQNKMKLLDSAV